MSFEFLEHTADIKVHVRGKTINNVFEEAARALSAYVAKDKKISAKLKKTVKAEAKDVQELLYVFLDELLFLLDAEAFIVVRARVNIKGTSLKAELWGDDTRKYKGLNHIKAATYAEMNIQRTQKGWEGQFVLDV